MLELAQGSGQFVPLGPFIDGSGNPLTNLSFTVYLLKQNGLDVVARNSASGISAYSIPGYYRVHLDATDTNTAGALWILGSGSVGGTNFKPIWEPAIVRNNTTWRAMVDGTASFPTNVIATVTGAVAVSGNYDKTGYSLAVNQQVTTTGVYDKTGYTIQSGTGAGQLDFTNGRIKADMVYLNGASLDGYNATFKLKEFQVVSNLGNAVTFQSSASNGHGLICQGNQAGDGVHFIGGLQGDAIHLDGHVYGLHIQGPTGLVIDGSIRDVYADIMVTATGVYDKTGYTLSQAFPSNFSNLNIRSDGSLGLGVTTTGLYDKSGISLAVNQLVVATGVTDKTGYTISQAFPSNFAALNIRTDGSLGLGVATTGLYDKSGISLAVNQLVVATGITDKTGYTLLQAFPSNFSALSIRADGSLGLGVAATGVYDKSGYVLSQTFPTNFSSLLISSTGATSGLNEYGAGSSLTAAQVRAEASGALRDFRLDEFIYQYANAPDSGSYWGRITQRSADRDRFTEYALSLGPVGTGGGGGVADWTTADKEQIRSALGIDGTKTAAVGGQLQLVAAQSAWHAIQSGVATPSTIWSHATRSLTTAVAVSGNYDKSGYTLIVTPPTEAQIAAAVVGSGVALQATLLTVPTAGQNAATIIQSGVALQATLLLVPSTGNINAALTQEHGAGAWTTSTLTAGQVASTVINSGVALSSQVPSTGNIAQANWGYTTRTVTLDSSIDIYYADIQFTKDDTNSKDEYTVSWFKNGSPVVAAVTSPTIQVVKRADGTDLIAQTAMSTVTNGVYKYDATTTSRLTAGEAAVVIVAGTIDGSSRTWRRAVGRDGS